MSDELNAFERLDADMPLPLDLRALEDRVIDDSLAWESIVPPADRLVEFARTLPAAGAPAQEDESPAGGPVARPGGTPERIRHRAAPARAPRRHALAAYAAAFGLMALTSLLLVQLASLRAVGTSVAPRLVEATATTPIVSPTPTSEKITPPTAAATTSSAGGDANSSGTAFSITRMVVWSTPREWTNDSCGATVPFSLAVGFYTSANAPFEAITYRWLHSDGYASAISTIQPSEITRSPNGPPGTPLYYTTWDMPATLGDGTQRWVAVEVLSPSHQISDHVSVSLTCQFGLHDVTASVKNVANGANPAPQYDCALGGDQTLEFTGVVNINAGPGSHTITYHWQSTFAGAGPDLSITVPPGATSATVQPLLLTVHQTDQYLQQDAQVIITSPSTETASYDAFFTKPIC